MKVEEKTMKMTMRVGCMAVLAFSAMTMAAGAQSTPTVKDDLFAGTEMFAKGASDVTEISMDPDSLGMVGGKEKARAHTLVLNVVRSYSYDKPGMYRIEDVDAFRDKLNTGDWHCSVHTRDMKRGESTDVCNKRRADDMSETAIITVEPKELTFIHTIRKKGSGEQGELDGMPMMGLGGAQSAAMQARMAAMGPILEARMAAMGPMIEARMAAMGPLFDARMAGLGDRMKAHEKAQRAMTPAPPSVPAPPAALAPPAAAQPE